MEVGEHDTLVGGGGKHQSFISRFKFVIIFVVILVVALGVVLAVVLSAKAKDNSKAWEDLIEVNNLMGHLQELQNIADKYNNTRASTTIGYNMSVEYIVGQLQKHTNYNVTVQHFSYDTLLVQQVSNINITMNDNISISSLVYKTDFGFMGAFVGVFDFVERSTAQVLNLGCDIADYVNVLPTTIAVISRGNCTFVQKINLAASKNPLAIVIYNNVPGLFSGSLGDVSIPVIATTLQAGQDLIRVNTTITLSLETIRVPSYTMNVIADTRVGRADRVIVVGSHLDSVPAGPGINDNGSGSALNIELALQLASESNQNKIKNKIRFCWFGAEELGLLGSTFYVNNLNQTDKEELARIAVNLNFDMIGSPNFIRGVYNGSSDPASNGSAVVQNQFNQYYASKSLSVTPTDFTGRSDYGPFLAAGIPAGGLFTGAEEVKTTAQRTMFGGIANAAYDPCYHQSCDSIENINQQVFEEMSQGAAHVLETLATQEDLQLFLDTL